MNEPQPTATDEPAVVDDYETVDCRVLVVGAGAAGARAAVELVDRFAPEHLEVQTENPRALLDRLSNYGTLFLGESSANVFSDKLIGTNHTLPTQRASRYTAGLSVHTFIKKPTYQEVSDEGVSKLEPWATKQSTVENLMGHAKSSYMRAPENELEAFDESNIELRFD